MKGEKIIEIANGLNPPADYINAEYEQKPSNPRKCEKYGIYSNFITYEETEKLVNQIKKFIKDVNEKTIV